MLATMLLDGSSIGASKGSSEVSSAESRLLLPNPCLESRSRAKPKRRDLDLVVRWLVEYELRSDGAMAVMGGGGDEQKEEEGEDILVVVELASTWLHTEKTVATLQCGGGDRGGTGVCVRVCGSVECEASRLGGGWWWERHKMFVGRSMRDGR